MTRTRILLATAACALGALTWVLTGERNRDIFRRPWASDPSPPEAPEDPQGLTPPVDRTSAPPVAAPQALPPVAAASTEAWLPTSVEVPRWGLFLLEIVDAHVPGAPGVLVGGKRISVMTSEPPPHFAIRLRASDGTSYETHQIDDLLERLEVSLRGLNRLGVARAGVPWVTSVVERRDGEAQASPVTVQVVPFEITGLQELEIKEGTTKGKIVAKALGVVEEDRRFGVATTVVLQNVLANPTIGPGGQEQTGVDRSEYASASVRVHGIAGVRRASVKLYIGERELLTSDCEMRMYKDGIERTVDEPVDDCLLVLVARVSPNWWQHRDGLAVVYEVLDVDGARHVLRWTPALD